MSGGKYQDFGMFLWLSVGGKGLVRKVQSVKVKTSTKDETDEIGATSITPKIIPRHSIAGAH